MLKKAYVEITNRCNLACSFCPKTKRAPRTMSAQEFGLVLSRLEGYTPSRRRSSPSLRRGT